jgi:tricorn protease
MKKTVALSCVFFVLLAAAFASAAPIKFARYPHIAKGKIAFSYHGDIWVANDDGTNPRRLTAHIANDITPRFSPDGKWIAFTSDRMGNNDVYVVPVEGGEPQQLTFLTTDDAVQYWTPDGRKVLFASNRSERPWGSPLYTIGLAGGIPSPLPMDQAALGMISSDGKTVAFNRIAPRYWRKGYKGNASAEIYVQDLATRETRQLTNTDLSKFRDFRQDVLPMWGADGLIYFLSERDGYFNIWKISPKGGQPAQVTFHKKDGIQFPSMSPDGTELIYECEFDLWKLKLPNGQPQRIALNLAFDPKVNLVEYLPADSKADGFSPSPKGDYIAVDFHGEIFVVPTEEGIGEMRQVTSSAWRDRFDSYSPNGKYLAYVSDESLDEEIWLYAFETGARRKLTSLASTKNGPIWSRDSKQLAFSADQKLYATNVETGAVRELAEQPGGFNISEFSPDGKWLVLTFRDDDANADVYLFNIAEKKFVNMTKNPFRDGNGALTPDGKFLVFVSNREAGTNQLYKVALARLPEDPDDPLVKERTKKEEEGRGRTDREKEAAAAPALTLTVDPAGAERRAIPITSGTNAVGDFFLSKDGRMVYFTSQDDKGPGLFSIGIDGKDRKKVTDGQFGSLSPTEDRKFLFTRAQNTVTKMELAPNKDKKKIVFAFKVTVDRRKEYEQIFEECWRVMKYRFYDPKMHGTDWEAVRRTYKPQLKYVGDYLDVYDLCNEMIGELNASHTGVSGPPGIERPSTYQTRYLGFELAPDKDFYRVGHIYRDGPADKEWLKLKEGDYVFAINGQEIKSGDNYEVLLNNMLNEYATVRVASEPNPKAPSARDIRIKTVTSLSNVKYQEWVKNSRDYVDKVSDGKIAYVHIRSMDQPSLTVFQNEVAQFVNKKGIIVDIRYNGGGNTDQEILDILSRKPYEYWNSRSGARSWGRRPQMTIAGPKIIMINWRSASDSEVTPQGFRDLGLGRIVGNPTNASVIATGSYGLINGGSIRTPGSLVVTYDPTKPNNYGIVMENFGVAPDVFVKNTPQDELAGFDRELDMAVKEALKMLKEGKWQYEK